MVNVHGIQNVLRAASNSKTKLFVNVSSVAALGFNDNRNDPINEHFVFNWKIAKARKKHYMLSKHKADKEVNKARSDGLQAIILYPGLMFGPGDVSNMGKLMKEIKKRGLPFLMPGGTNVVDVRDVAKGIIAVLKLGKPQENYLLSGINLSYKQIFTIITKELGTKSPKLAIPKSFNTLLYYVILLMESLSNKKISLMADNIDSSFKFRYYDNSKAKRELGWEPRIPFEETIKDAVKWMESHDLFES
jgi:dihydroflavonol-4-reductase